MNLFPLSLGEAPELPAGFDFFDVSTPTNVVLMLGFFVPLLTAFIAKKMASSQIKSIITLTLSVLLAVAGTLVGYDMGWDWRGFGNAFISAYLPAIGAYYGFWKPSGLSAKILDKTGNVGLPPGKPKPGPVAVVVDPEETEVPTDAHDSALTEGGDLKADVVMDGVLATDLESEVVTPTDPEYDAGEAETPQGWWQDEDEPHAGETPMGLGGAVRTQEASESPYQAEGVSEYPEDVYEAPEALSGAPEGMYEDDTLMQSAWDEDDSPFELAEDDVEDEIEVIAPFKDTSGILWLDTDEGWLTFTIGPDGRWVRG